MAAATGAVPIHLGRCQAMSVVLEVMWIWWKDKQCARSR